MPLEHNLTCNEYTPGHQYYTLSNLQVCAHPDWSCFWMLCVVFSVQHPHAVHRPHISGGGHQDTAQRDHPQRLQRHRAQHQPQEDLPQRSVTPTHTYIHTHTRGSTPDHHWDISHVQICLRLLMQVCTGKLKKLNATSRNYRKCTFYDVMKIMRKENMSWKSK